MQTAMELARRLEAHPRITRVHYPGLPSHPDHDIAVDQMLGGFGGVISFEVLPPIIVLTGLGHMKGFPLQTRHHETSSLA